MSRIIWDDFVHNVYVDSVRRVVKIIGKDDVVLDEISWGGLLCAANLIRDEKRPGGLLYKKKEGDSKE